MPLTKEQIDELITTQLQLSYKCTPQASAQAAHAVAGLLQAEALEKVAKALDRLAKAQESLAKSEQYKVEHTRF